MLSGFYTIASGVLTRQREIDTIGNNLVNAQTPGYHADRLIISSFEQEMLTRLENKGGGQLGVQGAATAAIVDGVMPLNKDGMLKPTERNADVAIMGEGYFNIQGDDGQMYLTRNGSFDVDEQGYLELPGVGRVMGTYGAINVQDTDFVVEANGDVYDSGGRYISQIRVGVPPDNAALQKLDSGMFLFDPAVQAVPAQNYTLSQGNIELSNVDMNQELTILMESQRAFQTCSAALQTIDGMNRKATQIAAV